MGSGSDGSGGVDGIRAGRVMAVGGMDGIRQSDQQSAHTVGRCCPDIGFPVTPGQHSTVCTLHSLTFSPPPPSPVSSPSPGLKKLLHLRLTAAA